MVQIPNSIFEQNLTSWLFSRLNTPFACDEDKEAIALLARLSKAQMI